MDPALKEAGNEVFTVLERDQVTINTTNVSDVSSRAWKGVRSVQAMMGPAGPMGPPGKDGADGKNGKDGKDGRDGREGRQGDRGLGGPRGEKGDRGLGGPVGPAGPAGPAGPGLSQADLIYQRLLVAPGEISGADMTTLIQSGKTLLELINRGVRYPGAAWITANPTALPENALICRATLVTPAVGTLTSIYRDSMDAAPARGYLHKEMVERFGDQFLTNRTTTTSYEQYPAVTLDETVMNSISADGTKRTLIIIMEESVKFNIWNLDRGPVKVDKTLRFNQTSFGPVPVLQNIIFWDLPMIEYFEHRIRIRRLDQQDLTNFTQANSIVLNNMTSLKEIENGKFFMTHPTSNIIFAGRHPNIDLVKLFNFLNGASDKSVAHDYFKYGSSSSLYIRTPGPVSGTVSKWP
jgi:hypothetical protein